MWGWILILTIGVLFYLCHIWYTNILKMLFIFYMISFVNLLSMTFSGYDLVMASKTWVLWRCSGFCMDVLLFYRLNFEMFYFPFWSVVYIRACVVEAKIEGFSLSEDEKGVTYILRTIMVWRKCWATHWLMTSFMQVKLFSCHEWAFDNDLEVWCESFWQTYFKFTATN